MFYSSKIFEKMGVNDKLGSGLVGFINMISTFGALFLLGSRLYNSLVKYIYRVWKKNTLMGLIILDGRNVDWIGYCLFQGR